MRLVILIAISLLLGLVRLALPNAPILRESVAVIAAADVDWTSRAYVIDARPGASDSVWPRLDEHDWDAGLSRILTDGAFSAHILVVSDSAHGAQVVLRLARELPEARVSLLLGGAAAVPAGYRWQRSSP